MREDVLIPWMPRDFRLPRMKDASLFSHTSHNGSLAIIFLRTEVRARHAELAAMQLVSAELADLRRTILYNGNSQPKLGKGINSQLKSRKDIYSQPKLGKGINSQLKSRKDTGVLHICNRS